MKALVETTGSFMLVDATTGDSVEHNRPSVCRNSSFLNQRAFLKQVRFLGEVTDEATDDEFLKFWNESDKNQELAVKSFLAKFGVKAEGEAKGKGKGKAADKGDSE